MIRLPFVGANALESWLSGPDSGSPVSVLAPVSTAIDSGVFLLDLPSTYEYGILFHVSVQYEMEFFFKIRKMAKKKPQRGGSREGAGRKPVHPEGVTIPVSAKVPIGRWWRNSTPSPDSEV